jgi:hypothetical protein
MAISSCKEKDKDDKEDFSKVKGNYFSIQQFGLDQWNNFPVPGCGIVKTVRKDNGKTDSSFTNSDALDWASIFKVFFETDISDRKFLGQYKFSQFDDPADGTHNFFYEAKDEDLFTQKLLITIDQHTNKVRGIYIETLKKGFIKGETIQKLYYRPYHTIQIQKDEKTTFGSKSFTVEQYDFML